jgi:hypothetical protein
VSPATYRVPIFMSIGLLFLAATPRIHAATADSDGNPYQAIVGRNVFSLKAPPPLPNPEDLIKKDTPPTIKLQGLNTILGRRQVLFKVLAKPPGQPKEESFVMTEGERQGDIEVLEINVEFESVKFKNRDQVQLLNMKNDAEKPPVGVPPPATPGIVPGGLPGVPPPTAAFNQPAPGTVTTIGGSMPIPQRPMRGPTTGGVPAGTGIVPQQAAQQPSPFTHEEQQALIEVKRKYYQDQGDPRGALLPPTSLSPPKQ